MREDGRVDMYAEADYSEGTTAYMWITNRIQKMADRIRDTEKAKITNSASSVPKHLVQNTTTCVALTGLMETEETA